MALQNGQLLVNRRQITLATGNNDIDTGLRQVRVGNAMDPDPTLHQRTMVIPLPPTDNWAGITMPSDPTFSTVTGTVHVVLNNAGAATTVNVLFWAPATIMGPISVDTYVI
jgi:hypothetical protein